MKYSVLIKISKQQLGFWYQLEGGAYAPLSINNTNIIPFCFYINGNDFQLGEFAKERYLLNDRNTFNDYFELIKDPSKHFTLHGDSKPVKQLLYYGVENYLSHFIKTILYKNESIEGFRTTFCLRFWFDDDIENQEKVLVDNLFNEAGYENVSEVDADFILNKEISQEVKSFRSRVCLSAISNDLYVKLYKSPEFNLVEQIKLVQLGSDPRAKILAKLILEDIKEANPHIHIDESKDIAYIINHCVKLLSALSPIMRDEVELSTGVKTDYKIRLAHLEERLMYNRGIEDKVIPQLESIISANVLSSSMVDIILIGDELNTNYFKDKLTKKFPNVYGIGSLIENKLLKAFFAEISLNNYQLVSKNFTASKGISAHTQANPPKTPAPPPLPTSSKPTVSVPPIPGTARPAAPPPPPPVPSASKPPVPPPIPGNSKPPIPPPVPGAAKPVAPPPVPAQKEVKKVSAPVMPSLGGITNKNLQSESAKKSTQKKNTNAQTTDSNNLKAKKSQIEIILKKLYSNLMMIDSQTKSKVFLSSNLNQTKYMNMMSKLGLSIPYTECLLQYDDTLFGAGDNGFLITEKYFIWRNLAESGKYISWNDIVIFSVDGNTKIILQDKSGFKYIINNSIIRKSLVFASCLTDILKIFKS